MDNGHNTYEKYHCVNRIELWVLWIFSMVDGTCQHGGKYGDTGLQLGGIVDMVLVPLLSKCGYTSSMHTVH